MSQYCYVKAPVSSPQAKKRFSLGAYLGISKKHLLKFSYVLMVFGVILVTYVIYPIVVYEVNNFLAQRQSKIVKPISEDFLAYQTQVQAKTGIVFGDQTDMSKINSWFPAATVDRVEPSRVTHYNLSIPSLGIINAVVTIGGDDLMKSLIQYNGTALPGEYGSPVIFGHSVLPQFFNPHDYKTIFSTIPTLKPGDEIAIDFDGIEFNYSVERYFEVSPDQVEVLQQYYNRQCLKLVTCVPPGLYLRRGIIEACLVND